jgi:hypothetical protein
MGNPGGYASGNAVSERITLSTIKSIGRQTRGVRYRLRPFTC